MERTVGIVGLGIMGGAIARNLVERGWRVLGYDVLAGRRAELAAAGVEIRPDVDAVTREAPRLLLSLPTRAALGAVAAEIVAAGTEARIVAESSTFALDDKLAFEATLTRAGHTPLDCPLSGTGAQAVSRDLVVYASGDRAAADSCAPLFADFAKKTAYLGAFGNGSRMKYVANLLVAVHNVAAAEAMVLAMKSGLDPEDVIDVIAPGAGGSRMFEMRAPMMVERIYEPATMKVSTWKKDMAIIAEFADDIGCTTPLFTLTQPVYSEAMAMGLGDQDTASVFEVLKKTIVKPSA